MIERMFEKSTLNDGGESFYGYGLGISGHNGKLTIGHSGQTGSFLSMVIYVPEDEVGIAILANTGRIKAKRMGYEIFDLFYGKQDDEKITATVDAPVPFISLDSFSGEDLAGAYLIDGNAGRLLVSRSGDGFYCIFDGFGSDEFRPVSETRLENRHRNVRIYLHRQNDGPARLMLDLKGDTMWASHLDAPTLTAEQLAADSAGKYYCVPLM